MKTVILSVRTLEDASRDVEQVWKSAKGQQCARRSFATAELMWKTLTFKRWELLRAMCGKGPMTFRKAAELVGRDVKAVHGDLTKLINAGLVDKTEQGVEFPFEALKLEYEFKATG